MSLLWVLLPLAAIAAENNVPLQEQIESRRQSQVLPENGINSLASPASQQQPRISRRQASNIASGNYEGRVLSIRLDNDNWRVRMDRDGTVFNVFVNASSGNVSSSSD